MKESSIIKLSVGEGTILQIVSTISSVILTILLKPEIFGQFSFLLSTMAILMVLIESGYSVAIVQAPSLDESDMNKINSLLLRQSLLGSFAFISIAFAANLLFSTYWDFLLVSIFALKLPISAIGVVPQAYLRRNKDVLRLVRINLMTVIFSYILTIVLALVFHNIYSLIAFQIISVGLQSYYYRKLHKIPFNLLKTIDINMELKNFSNSVLGSSLVTRIFEWLLLIIGTRLMGYQAIGIFTRSKSLFYQLPLSFTNKYLSGLMTSIYRYEDDIKVRKALFRHAKLLVPIFICMYIIGYFLLPKLLLIFGENWQDLSISYIPMAISAIFALILMFLEGLKKYLGDVKVVFLAKIISSILVIFLILLLPNILLWYSAYGIFAVFNLFYIWRRKATT